MNDAVYEAEQAYSDALLAIAMGDTRDETRGALIDSFPRLSPDDVNDALYDAYRDALKQGVEREDIDDSWHTY